jgi:hypothetical protein
MTMVIAKHPDERAGDRRAQSHNRRTENHCQGDKGVRSGVVAVGNHCS